jgi:hypothetical protein
MHVNSELLLEKYAKPNFNENMLFLEIGSNENFSTYRKIITNDAIKGDALRISNILYFAKNRHEFPVPDNTIDVIVSEQVIDHVKNMGLD